MSKPSVAGFHIPYSLFLHKVLACRDSRRRKIIVRRKSGKTSCLFTYLNRMSGLSFCIRITIHDIFFMKLTSVTWDIKGSVYRDFLSPWCIQFHVLGVWCKFACVHAEMSQGQIWSRRREIAVPAVTASIAWRIGIAVVTTMHFLLAKGLYHHHDGEIEKVPAVLMRRYSSPKGIRLIIICHVIPNKGGASARPLWSL